MSAWRKLSYAVGAIALLSFGVRVAIASSAKSQSNDVYTSRQATYDLRYRRAVGDRGEPAASVRVSA